MKKKTVMRIGRDDRSELLNRKIMTVQGGALCALTLNDMTLHVRHEAG